MLLGYTEKMTSFCSAV